MELSVTESTQEQKFGDTAREVCVEQLLDIKISDDYTIKHPPKMYVGEIVHIPINYLWCDKKIQINKDRIKQKKIFLSINSIQKMIGRLLFEKKIPKEKLAKILAIKTKEVENFAAKRGSKRLIPKINLPLIKLYCKTRWKV